MLRDAVEVQDLVMVAAALLGREGGRESFRVEIDQLDRMAARHQRLAHGIAKGGAETVLARVAVDQQDLHPSLPAAG